MKFLFLKDGLLLSWLWDLLHFWSLPHPAGYFPFADARIYMNLLCLLRPGLGLNILSVTESLSLQV